MSGHGWVYPNVDGSRARCGGPGIYPTCSAEKSLSNLAVFAEAGAARNVAFFLHAYYLNDHPLSGEPPLENVGCVRVSSWEVQKGELPVPFARLFVKCWSSALRVEGRPWAMVFDLKPGNRFFIVRNDGVSVQEPNGPIIWKWVDGVETSLSPR